MTAPTPTASPSSVRTDTRVDEQWKADLRKRIEHDLLHIVEDIRIVRDTIFNSRPTESSREHAQREYEESMNNIRTLAQEKFIYLYRQEMSEQKQALNIIDSHLLDISRQQQWFPDSIHQADEERTSLISHAFQNDGGILSTHPQQADGEQGSDKRSEGGYGSAGAENEPGESRGGTEVGFWEGDSNPQQLPSTVPTQPLHSNSPVSQKKSLSHQRRPSTSKPADDNDGEDRDGSHVYHALQHGSQPYSPRQSPSPGSQHPVGRSDPLASEPSGVSCAFVCANGSIYNTSAGLNGTGSQNPDQDRGSSIAHRDTERPLENRDLILPNIALRERQNSAPASSHDGSSPSTCPRVLRRTITYDSFPSGDTTQGIPRKHINSEDLRGTSRGSLRSHPSFDDLNFHLCVPSKGDPTLPPALSGTPDSTHVQLDDQHRAGNRPRVRSVQSIDSEQTAVWWETETQRKGPDATRKEDDVRRKRDEALLVEKKARQSLLEAKRLEVVARQAEVAAKMYEAAAQKKEAEAKREVGTKKREAEAKQREAEAKRREAEEKKRETKAKKREAETETKERMVEAQRKVEAARQRVFEAHLKEEEAKRDLEQASKREEDARRKEDDARRRLDDARRKDHSPGQALETPTWQALGSSRHEVTRAEDTTQFELTKADAAKRLDREHLIEQERLLVEAQRREENRFRDEQWRADEKERCKVFEEQPRKFDEKSRRPVEPCQQQHLHQYGIPRQCAREEQEEFDLGEARRAMERERQNSVGVSWVAARSTTTSTGSRSPAPNSSVGSTPSNRPSHMGNPATMEGIGHPALSDSEQRRKIAEPGRQHDQSQPQRHQDEIPRQRIREVQRLMERERQNSVGVPFDSWGLHPPAGPTVTSASSRSATPNSSFGSTQSTRPSRIGNSNTHSSSSSPSTVFSTSRKAPLAGTRAGDLRIPSASKLEEGERGRRAEERVRQQREHFGREDEQLEGGRQAKVPFPRSHSISRKPQGIVDTTHAQRLPRMK